MSEYGFRIGRAYDEPAPEDGHRVLVDRLWPRGIAKATAPWDEWLKDVAPSPDLRRWYHQRPGVFTEFQRRYAAELDDEAHSEAVDYLRRLGKSSVVTLLTAKRDPEAGHVPTLVEKLITPS